MLPVLVLMGPMPPLGRDLILRTVEQHADVRVVGHARVMTELRALAYRHRPDAIVLEGPEDGLPPEVIDLFAELPRLIVYAVSPNAASIAAYRLKLARTQIEPATPAALGNAIRTTRIKQNGWLGFL